MSTKRKIWLLSLVYLFISITVGFLNKANSQQLADQPLDWMSQVKTAISSTSLQKIPATVRSLINAPAEYLEMNSRFMQITKIGTDQPEIALLVKFNGNIKSLESAGAKIGSKIGDIYTVNIPINRLGDLAALKNVVCIEPSMKAYPTLDNSIIENKANLVHQGNYGTTPPVYSGYTGKDVIVGAIDSGIDWEHEDFIDDNNNTSRILYIWDQTLTPQNGEYNPSGFTYGVEYTQTQLNNEIDGSPAGFVRTEDTDGHGTHVTGIIAGDGSSTGGGIPNYTYVGMAPQADILFIKTGFYFNEIIDGIHYAMQKADILGKPLVINLSLSSQYGAHDGTSLFDQTIDNAVNTGKVTIVVSAGNDGTDIAHGSYIHAEGNVTTDSTSTITFSVPSYSANSSAGNDLILIDMWYQGGDDINVKINTPNGYTWDANTGSDNNNNALNSLDGAIYIDNAVNGLDTNNFDRECYIQIWDYYSYRTPESSTWTITITGNNITESGHFDSWIYASQLGNENSYFTSSSGSNRELIGSPSAAEQAITVAAHTVTNSWVDYWGSSHTYTDAVLNDLAFFSSAGPTRDDPGYLTGRQKPDICASGFGVISARSSDATGTSSSTSRNEDGKHLMMSGTSMSSPMVAGAVALMMDKDPTLSGQQIKTYLGNSAISDAFTGSVPNNLWGYGKLDIYETMQQFDPPEQALKIFPSSQTQYEFAGDTASYILTIKNLGSQSDSYDLTVSGNTWPTSIWDNTGTTEIINTGTISPDVEFIIIVKIQIPAKSVPDDNDEAIVRVTSNGNSEVYAESIINTGVAHPSGTLPWSDDFSSLTLDDVKWTSNTGLAEINDNGANKPSSPYSLNLNGNSTGGDDIQSQFIDLSGKENVILSYYYQRTGGGDSPETGDDLWVDYYSPSESWINLCQYLGSGSDMSSYTREDIALPPDAMHNQFRIRFHNSGTSGEYDDWFIDDVSLNIVSPPDITVTPASITETLSVGDSTVKILKIENSGAGDLNYNISIEYNNPVSAIDYFKLSGNTHKINEQISRSEYSTASLSLNENNKLTSSTGSLQIHKQNAIKENELDMISYHPAKINNKIKNVKNGNTIYVDVNNTSGIEDGTPEHPYRLIQTGINNASNGYVIIVRQGIYNENNISVNKSVTLQGNGAIINGNEIGDMIKGFMLHQGVQDAIINNFTITNCYWPIFVYGTSGGGNQIINNTLAYNASTAIAIFNDCIIINNIVTFNGGFGICYYEGVLQNSYNDIYGNTLSNWYDCSSGTGSFSDDPLFVNQAGNDFHLQSGSPCINAGNPSSIYNDSDGSRNDMGAFGGPNFETTTSGWLSVTPLSGNIASEGSHDISVKLNAKNLTPGSTYYASIIISSNDPGNPTVTIPVDMEVNTGMPYDVSVTPEIQNLAGAAGNNLSCTLTIKNKGANADSYNLTSSGNTWPTSIWDADGINPISTTGNILPSEEVDITVKVEIPATAGSGDSNSVNISANSVNSPPVSDTGIVNSTVVSVPDITVSPSDIDESLDAGDSTVNILEIENTGSGDLDYSIVIEYVELSSSVNNSKFSGNTDEINEQLSAINDELISFSPTKNLQSSALLSQICYEKAIEKNELNKQNYNISSKSEKQKNKLATGNTIYVDVNNTTGIEDGSELHPYSTIQAGVNNSSSGDIVYVVPGIYHEMVGLSNSNILIQGNGAILDVNGGTGDGWDGFSVWNGVSDITITGFNITNSGTNDMPNGIFIYSTGSGVIEIINNTIAGNCGTAIPVFDNCLIMNNIIAFNSGFGISYFEGTLQNSYNDVYGNSLPDWHDCSAGTGSFSDDPLFVNQAGNDFHLQSGSPCINAGNPSSIYNDSDGSRNDMGAFGGPYIVGDDKEWLSVTPLSGSISPDGSQNLMVKLNAINLTTGHTYNANIIISSNDPVDPVITIPVELSVISSSTSPEIVNLYDFSITNYESYIINLDTCVIDNDDDVSTMTWEVTTTSPKIIIFSENRTVFISCNDHGWNGAADITFKVTDPQLEYDENTVECTVNIPTSIDDLLDYIPNGFCLEQNYPNPGYPRTTIIYGMPKAADVSVSIYDLNGLLLLELVNGKEPSGYHSVIWETYDWPEGTYIIKMVAVDFVQTRKCLLIK